MKWEFVVFRMEDIARLPNTDVKEQLGRKTMLPWCVFEPEAEAGLVTPKSFNNTNLTAMRVYETFRNVGLPVQLVTR